MKAVVWTDALQGVIYIGGVLLVMSIVSISSMKYNLQLFSFTHYY